MPLWQAQRARQSVPPSSPIASFAYLNGSSSQFFNDFVAFAEPCPRPIRVHRVLDDAEPDHLWLAHAGSDLPGARADLAWPADSSASLRRLAAIRPSAEHTGVSSGETAGQPLTRPPPPAIDWSPIEVQDRQVLRSKLDDIQRLCGQKFTLDATCTDTGSNKQFPRCCANLGSSAHAVGTLQNLDSLRDEHVWFSLTADSAAAVMSRYLELKALSPTTTSGCFLVPYRPDCDWFDHFSHMQLLKEYGEGTSVFFIAQGKRRQYLPGLPGAYRVYYDPPDPDIGATSAKPKFLLQGRVFSAPGKVFIDGGANTQYIGADTCRAMNAKIRVLDEQPGTVQVGDGHEAKVIGTCRVPVQIGAYKGMVTALVLDKFAKDFDLILGESWLKAYKAQLNYGAYGAMRLRVANRVVILRVGQRGAKAKLNAMAAPTPAYAKAVRSGSQPEDLITSANGLKKALKQNNGKYFLINVRFREKATPSTTPDVGQLHAVTAATSADGRQEILVSPEPTPFDHPLDTAGVYSSEPSAIKSLGGELVVEKQALDALLAKYQDVFPEGLPPGMPPDRNVVHPITLEPNAKPSYRPMYRLSPEEKAECETQVKDLLDKGLIQPSSSPWGSPILFVPKPNGKLRMCCDFRMLNKATIKNKFPLPRIDDLLDVLHGKKVFSSLDLQSGYWQIALRPEDMKKTAFNTHFGHFEYKVMCFGLSNAPATFQSLMNDIFRDYLGKFVVVYLDDILIYSDTPEQHMKHLELVLKRLREHKLYAQMAKCDFGLSELKFLGHIVGAAGISPDPDKVKVVHDWPEPANAAELRSFLGLAQYFRKFIQGYAQAVCCLYDLLKTNAVFSFQDKHRAAVEAVKYALTHAPVLKMPDYSKPFEIWSDASTHGIGAVLMQDGHPVSYESRKLSSAEYNYTTTEQELLAVVHALKTFRPYIQSSFTTNIFTDHRALEWLLTKQEVSRREARWLEEISRYNLKLSYIPGRNSNPGAKGGLLAASMAV